MTTRRDAKRVLSLTVIEARDIKNVPNRPALYVSIELSGEKLCKTKTIQSVRPTWGHTCSMTVESASVLCFRLKHSRRLAGVAVLGSVDISIIHLLNQNKNDQQRAALTLLDQEGRVAGSLVVQLCEAGAQHAAGSALPGISWDAADGEMAGSPPVLEPGEGAVRLAVVIQDPDSDVVGSLKQVVGKTKALVDVVGKATRLHLHASIAWHIMSSAHKAVEVRLHGSRALLKLVRSLGDLYAFVDVSREFKSKIQGLEDVIVRITIQTAECGIFIMRHTLDSAHQSILDTDKMIANLSEALGLLKEELGPGKTSQTAFVPARLETSSNVKGQVRINELKALLGPANMDVDYRESCLPGTRVEILQDLLVSLTDPKTSYNIIWLRGLAGSGKSTMLNTIAQYLSELYRCGAFLFWGRNDPVNGDPRRVIRTLAYQLASFNSDYAEKLASQIKRRPQITSSSFNAQFQHLLSEPLSSLAMSCDLGPIIIVLDALDECGDRESRKELLRELSAGLSKLPSMFRVLIASRDEPDIRVALSRPNIDIRDVEIDDESTMSDISQFFRCHLVSNSPAFVDYDLPPDWPGDQAIEELVNRAGGLFIWASTTIRFVEGGIPNQRLKKVLQASAHGEPHDKLDELYWVALSHPFRSSDQSEVELVCSILGAIMVAREPLTDEQLSDLLNLELGDVRGILSRLQPLLQWRRGAPVRVLHTSFTDFLCDVERCRDSRWCITASTHHQNMVYGCLQVMRRDLKFNICGIETSYYRHKEIDGIQERIDAIITPVLMYAGQYWADHLDFVSLSDSRSYLADAIMHFIEYQVLYWIEVFSLKNRMSTVSVILKKVAIWTRDCSPKLQTAISEAYNFVIAFGYPIGQSVPHIYISALPFLPSGNPLHNLRGAFQNLFQVEVGISERWPIIRQTLSGHSDSIRSLTFSPDGTRIASGSDDRTVRIWDAVSGSPICEPLQGHAGEVRSVAFSPDSTRIVSCSSDKTIQMWDAMSGASIGEPLWGHADEVCSVAFSPDGARIVSGAGDGTVRIWDAMLGAPICEPLHGHTDTVRSVAFSPDATRIVSGADDGTIRIWDAMLGTPISKPLGGHAGRVCSVVFSPDSTRIISGSDDTAVRIWDVVSGSQIGEPLQGHTGPVLSVAISPSGSCIVSASTDDSVRIWDAMSHTLIIESQRGSPELITFIDSVAFSPDFSRTATGFDNGPIYIWDATSDATSGEPLQGHITFSRDGAHTTSCSGDKMSGGSIAKPLQGHASMISSVAFSSDGTRIASGSRDKTVRMWDAVSGATIGEPLRGHAGRVNSVAFSPDGTRIVSGSGDKTVRIWDALSGIPNKPLQGHTESINSVAFSPDGTRIVSGSSDRTVRIWDVMRGAPISDPLRGHTGEVLSVAFSSDGTRIVSSSQDKTVRIWDPVSGATIGKPLRGAGTIRSVAFSGTHITLGCGISGNRTRIWDVVSGAIIAELQPGHGSSTTSAAFSPDGTRLVSGSYDKTMQIWDVATGAPIGKPLRGHIDMVFSVTFSPDGTRIASGSRDNTVRIWDAMPGATTDEPPHGHVGAVCLATPFPDGTRPVSGLHDKSPMEPEAALSMPAFSSLRNDGWVTTKNGSLLFWVPPDHRAGLFWPGTLAVLGARPTKLNMERFVHGPEWTLCHTE